MALHIIMAGIEHRVENTTSFVAKPGSLSYFAASMLVVAPAGMAASSTDIPRISAFTGSARQTR